MKKSVIICILVSFMLCNLSGCAPLIIGAAAGGLGACAISRDTVQGETDKSYDSLWNSVLIVGRSRGLIKQQDKVRGVVELEAEKSRVWVRLIRLTRSTIRLRISARKYRLPNLSLAEDLFVKIMEGAR